MASSIGKPEREEFYKRQSVVVVPRFIVCMYVCMYVCMLQFIKNKYDKTKPEIMLELDPQFCFGPESVPMGRADRLRPD